MDRITHFTLRAIGFLLFTLMMVLPGWGQLLPYRNPALSFEERAADLLGRLTAEEKISLMMNDAPAIERLGIPPYEWWNEALHGVARAGKATVFPQAIGLAATFNDRAVQETFKMVSDEARAKHHDAKKNGDFRRYRGLTFWTPNINIFRDPRWGRGMETYGEDPYLTGRMGVAVVRGLQGDPGAKYDKTHACAKHFAVHSGPEWNRHSYDAQNISRRDLLETYLPAFRELVQEAGVKEVMCAYNRIEGVPCCGSENLLSRILREEWGFKGVVVSDCGAISDFWVKGRHETHPDRPAASAAALLAGTDIECGNDYRALKEALDNGLITEKEIDRSVLRLLTARMELGMFDDDSHVPWASIPMSVVESEPHKAQALEMARESIVLLKNRNQTLPLSKKLKKVAVVGPNANDSVMMWANYNGIPTHTVTILEGIRRKLPSTTLLYERGCDLANDKVFTSLFGECSSGGVPGFSAVYYNTPDYSGEVVAKAMVTAPFSFSTFGNTVFAPGVALTNFSARYEAVFTPSENGEVVFRLAGDDGYVLKINGEEVVAANERGSRNFNRREYILQARKGVSYQIELSYYQTDRWGILNFDLGRVTTLDYEAIASRVSDAEAIIFVGGLSPQLEGEEMPVDLPGFRSGDRTTIELPQVQRNLLKALKNTGKPVIFVLCTGSALALQPEDDLLDAILNAWYPGQMGGTAVADVLFGDYNPAGRLPVTFYTSTEQLPDFEDYHMNKGRTYRYLKEKPLYPFGHGLSYTTFTYGKGKLSRNQIKPGEPLSLRFTLQNNGQSGGDEIVQVYIRNLQDPEGAFSSLRAFKRVHLSAGTKKRLTIDLPPKAFEFYNPLSESVMVTPGEYEILFGGSSDPEKLRSTRLTISLSQNLNF